MTLSPRYLLFIPLVIALLFTPAIAAPESICEPCSCVLTPIPTCTPTPTPTPIPTTANPNKGTAGLQGGCAGLQALGAANWYGWSFQGWGACPDSEPIPMVRDWDQLTAIISGTLQVQGDPDYILLFNEPDLCPDQACMTIDEVVLGQAIAEALFPDRLIVAPVYSQDGYSDIALVYDAYVSRYGQPPRWDVLATHCYFSNDSTACEYVVDWYVAKAYTWGIDEVWVTEFAALAIAGTTNPIWEPAVLSGSAFIDHLEANPIITRYYWYPYGFLPHYTSTLINDDGTLTPLGEMYRSK